MLPKVDLNYDIVLPFHLQNSSIRGRLVRLDEAMWNIIHYHNYPDLVNDYLSQMTALSLAIINCFKFNGVFTLQISGDGPIRLLVVNVNAQGHMRACARFNEDRIQNLSNDNKKNIHHVFGQATMMFSIEPEDGEKDYQGIVELSGSSLAECTNHFFRQSEQLETGIVVASSHNKENLACAALMIQRLPLDQNVNHEEREREDDRWIHALSVTGSVTKKELLDRQLSNEDLLHRLFWEEGAIVSNGKFYVAQCHCSQDRIFDMLSTFSAEDRQDMVMDEKITVTCEFCSRSYAFTEHDFE